MCIDLDICGIIPGRPLLVEGAPRTAEIHTAVATAAGVAWSDGVSHAATARTIDPALSQHLAAHWAEAAALEHASVASFARHLLELLGLGAPPTLVAEVCAAMADEVEHAKLAFSLASRFAGRPLGPGPLIVDGAVAPRAGALAIALGVALEGCICETLAAGEAALAAEGCRDPASRAALLRIAEDEGRHAALAWRTLDWLTERLTPSERQETQEQMLVGLRRVLAASEAPALPRAPHTPALTAHGIADPRDLASLHHDLAEHLVLPLIHQLLG